MKMIPLLGAAVLVISLVFQGVQLQNEISRYQRLSAANDELQKADVRLKAADDALRAQVDKMLSNRCVGQ